MTDLIKNYWVHRASVLAILYLAEVSAVVLFFAGVINPLVLCAIGLLASNGIMWIEGYRAGAKELALMAFAVGKGLPSEIDPNRADITTRWAGEVSCLPERIL